MPLVTQIQISQIRQSLERYRNDLAFSLFATILLAGRVLPASGQINYKFNDGQVPIGTMTTGVARVGDDGMGNNVLHLTDAGQNGAFGGFAIPDPTSGKRVSNLHVRWRSLIGGGQEGGADGYSFNWGTDLATFDVGEEGTGTGLSVTVDTWDNSLTGTGDIGIEIKWGGPEHASVGAGRIGFLPLPKDALRRNQFVNAELMVDGCNATFTYDGQTVRAPLPGYTDLPNGSFSFGARTGGANDNHWIDDIRIDVEDMEMVNIVTNLDDTGPGSLRHAIACGSTRIVFAPTLQGTIRLSSGELLIDKSLTITGPTSSSLSISGNGSRVFHVTSGTVSLSNLTIRDGFAEGYSFGLFGPGGDGDGGGILNEATLTLTACTLTGNTAKGGLGGVSTVNGLPAGAGGNGNGGGIFNKGILQLIICTLSSNSAVGGIGGNVFDLSAKGGNSGNGNGGALFNQGILTVTQCTFSSNSVTSGTAGVGAPIGDNGSGNGGGICSSNGIVTLGSSLIAGNSAASAGPDVAGALTSSGYNVVGTTGGSSGIVNGVSQDQAGSGGSPINAKLGPLQNNGGPTLTHALLTDSPAIDQGKSFGLTTDQRGRLRMYDFANVANASGGDGSDVGAFEMQPSTLILMGPLKSGNNMVISFSSKSAQRYRIEREDIQAPGGWTTVLDNIAGTGGIVPVTDFGAATRPKGFYRGQVLP